MEERRGGGRKREGKTDTEREMKIDTEWEKWEEN